MTTSGQLLKNKRLKKKLVLREQASFFFLGFVLTYTMLVMRADAIVYKKTKKVGKGSTIDLPTSFFVHLFHRNPVKDYSLTVTSPVTEAPSSSSVAESWNSFEVNVTLPSTFAPFNTKPLAFTSTSPLITP